MLKAKIDALWAGMQVAIRDDNTRKELMFKWLNVLLALVAGFMTAVNVFTGEYTLMVSTLLFAVACVINVALMRRGKRRRDGLYLLFGAESLVLLAFFIVSGIPNGFSALWLCLIPSFSMLIFGCKSGTGYSMVSFFMLLFFFWLPAGRALLRYRYTDEFMLRFPFFFVACYLMALLVETIRAQTQKQLLESELQYRHLYRHDALTGLYNRYGFNAAVDADYARAEPGKIGMMILDIDSFKRINDRYGHNNGDVVLKGIADILQGSFCERTHYCRWGGEEFTVYLHCEHDYREAAERVRRMVEEAEFKSGDLAMKATVSVGLCIASSVEAASAAALVNSADACLYRAKDQGKNCVVSVEI